VSRAAAIAALGLILAMTCSCRREHAPAEMQPYAFYFYESTGSNKYVLIDGTERAIEFDHETSDETAVNALLSLKWNVLYPNSKGVITLLGTCLPGAHKFSLQHWFLPTPFRAYPGETTLEPGPLEWRDNLDRSDFSPALGEDPRIYQRAPTQLLRKTGTREK
jgi:hypothetical protein